MVSCTSLESDFSDYGPIAFELALSPSHITKRQVEIRKSRRLNSRSLTGSAEIYILSQHCLLYNFVDLWFKEQEKLLKKFEKGLKRSMAH